MEVVKVEVEVPKATWELKVGASKVVADVAKALENGWQPWGDVRDIVDSVSANLIPVAGNVLLVPAEFVAAPVAVGRVVGLVIGELLGFAVTKLKGK